MLIPSRANPDFLYRPKGGKGSTIILFAFSSKKFGGVVGIDFCTRRI